jgi:uncharacterized BrkB/YihY/UPF0761 family membrane protein
MVSEDPTPSPSPASTAVAGRTSGHPGRDGPSSSGWLGGLRLRAQQRGRRLNAQYEQLVAVRPVLALPFGLYARFISRQGLLLASAIAFRLYLTLMPLALLAAGILAGLSSSRNVDLASAVRQGGITGAASQQVVTALRQGHKSWWVAVVIGAAGVVWAGRSLVRTVSVVNAHAWQVSRPVHRVRRRAAGAAIFTAGLLVIVALASAVAHLDRAFGGGAIAAAVLEGAGIAAIWLGVCLTLPDGRRHWTDLLPGCVLVGVAVAVLHAVSRIYLPARVEHASHLYGALGVAAVILAWLLLIGDVLVLGTLTNSVWSDYRADRQSPV